MAEASMISVFNSKIEEFNKAIQENDTETIAKTGREILSIGFKECSKPGTVQSVKDSLIKQCMAVLDNISSRIGTPAPARVSGGTGEDVADGSDPYYVTKNWFSDEAPDLNFSNIIGVQEVKDAFLVNVVAPLQSAFQPIYKKFRGDKLGSQILLYGPPGTGKTHIVKCLAGALGCKIAVVQTSEVLASVVGVAEKNVRDIFAQAAELDRCIIFLDEIDSICSDRGSDDSRNTKSILTTMLTCMDGFIKTKNPNQLRIIVAATNLPWKLDSALKRGGRFETQIYVPLPDARGREMFIQKGLSRWPHDGNVTTEWLVSRLEGYSGADINAILQQIADRPMRRAIMDIYNKHPELADREAITLQDCETVIKNYINSVTPEMLKRFEAYENGRQI